MTVDAFSLPVQYATNGTTGPWTAPFYFLLNSHILVTYTDSAGVDTTLTYTTDYTVSGEGAGSGTVTTTTAYPSGGTLTIDLATPIDQQTDYVETDSFPAESHERALDKLTLIVRQVMRLIGSAVRLPLSAGPVDALGDAASRALRSLGFDADGNISLNIPASGTAIDLALQLASSLLDTQGAGMVGFRQSGIGAVARTTLAKMREVYSVEDAGAVGDGVTDDTAAINYAAAEAAAQGRTLRFKPGTTYLCEGLLVFPADLTVISAGAEIRFDGSSTLTEVQLTIGNGFRCDTLKVTSPGTETNTNIISLGVDIDIERLIVEADAQRTGGGITCTGQDIRIGVLRTRKIDRPIHFWNQGTSTQTTGSYIGFLDIQGYVRGYRGDFCSFTIGKMYMRGRSANASKTNGHNGVLIQGCADWTVGPWWIEDAGEHAFRVGGSAGAYAKTRDFEVGPGVAVRCGGCALKLNPSFEPSAGVTETVDRGQFGFILGVDVGDGTLGGNEELLRISHARNIKIAGAYAAIKTETVSAQYGLIANDVVGLDIGSLGGDNIGAGFISFDSTSDADGAAQFAGNVTDVRIGRITGACGGGNAITVAMNAFSVARILIQDMDITGWSSNLYNHSTGTLSGPFEIKGRARGGVAPSVGGTPGSNLILDLRYLNSRAIGRGDSARSQAGAWQVTQPAFSAADALPAGIYANSAEATAGSGTYGASIELGRPGSSRRGGAVAVKQTGGNGYNTGVSVLASGTGTSSDLVRELAVFEHTGSLALPMIPTYANNAAAVTGGLAVGRTYQTSTGEVRIVV